VNGPNPTSETTQDAAAHLVIAVIRATRSMLKDPTLISRQSELLLHLRKRSLLPSLATG